MDTPSRLLRLLGLLSSRSWWGATELAAETGVTERTVRRDVTRLRDLGYPVEATTGRHGGYTLGRGGHLPPLVLDDDEAVAVALGLRAAAGGATGAESAALSALAKLDQVLPARLRERVAAVAAVTVGLRGPGVPEVDLDQLVTAGLACRRPERLRFTYRAADDAETERHVEPYRLVYTDQFWYLVAWDPARQDWRTFRVDRMRELHLTNARFDPHPDPPDPAELVAQGVAVAAYDHRASIRLHVPLERARTMVPATIAVLRAESESSCVARIGGDADWIARYLAGIDCTFEVLDSDRLRAELRKLGRRLVREHR